MLLLWAVSIFSPKKPTQGGFKEGGVRSLSPHLSHFFQLQACVFDGLFLWEKLAKKLNFHCNNNSRD